MAKITVHGGPSQKSFGQLLAEARGEVTPELVAETEPELQAPVSTEPGCLHPNCGLEHPHSGPAILGRPETEPETERATGGVAEGLLVVGEDGPPPLIVPERAASKPVKKAAKTVRGKASARLEMRPGNG